MSLSQYEGKDCKIEVRKYVLVSHPSRWQSNRERVVVQSPMLNIPTDISLVPVKRFNGEEQNLVCFLPRADIERDSNDSYQRLHVSKSPSSIEAHGTALCDSSLSDDFEYVQNDRFWIYVKSSTEGYKDKVPVINLRTFQSGDVPVGRVCWFPKIFNTSTCSETKTHREQLWTPGGPTRKLKLSGSKNYAHWSFVVCQFTDGTKPIVKSVQIPAKDTESQESRYLSLSESSLLFETRRRCMMEQLYGNLLTLAPVYLLPTPPASPELEIVRKLEKGKGNQPPPLTVQTDGLTSVWERIKDMATRRPSQINHYVLRNSPIHADRSQSEEGSEDRGRSASISLATEDYDSDSDSSSGSSSSGSHDASPAPDSLADAEYSRKDNEGQHFNNGIILRELFHANEDLAKRPNRLAFSAADPSIASDPTRIRADWDANQPGHNPKLDNLCQRNDPHCPYTTSYTCKHYHPDPAKCLLDKQPLFEFYEPSPVKLSKEWKAWTEANRSTPQQDRHADHEHCITRLRPYPAGAGDCMLAGNPLQNHVCCVWVPQDLDGLGQNFTRAYNKWKAADAERHRIEIFDQSNLVRTETRLVDVGISEDQLGWGGKALQFELDEGDLGAELEYLEMDREMLEGEKGKREVANILRELGVQS